MADIHVDNEQESNQGEMLEDDQNLATVVSSGQYVFVGHDGVVSPATINHANIVGIATADNDNMNETVTINADILRQAFQEAENGFVDTNASADNIQDCQTINLTDMVQYTTTSDVDDETILNSIVESTFTGEDGVQYAVLKSREDGTQQIVMTGGIQVEDEEPETMQSDDLATLQEPGDAEDLASSNDATAQSDFTNAQNDPKPVADAEEVNEAPLGSSNNPIRIIQQGNQYTSLQQLTPEQLTHIMQVLQQQQAVKPTQQKGTTTLYSPQTNTKIVYRVIYPSNDKKTPPVTKSLTPVSGFRTSVSGRGRGRGGRGRGRGRPRKDEEEDPNLPDLSKEERERKKKIRPRTRSGRVSKPPKHMVKDYKHIHLVDWEEDYDDSDGGYSDFQPSSGNDDEEDFMGEDDEDEDIGENSRHGNSTSKAKNFSCQACDKTYIGQGSLNRHYRLFPGHGTPTDEGSTVSGPNGSINEESNSSTCSASLTTTTRSVPVSSRGRGARSFVRRGKLSRRKTKLKEVMKHFTDEELIEIVLPRLAEVISTWDVLLMRSERGSGCVPSIPDMLNEYEAVTRAMRKYSSEHLSKTDDESDVEIDDKIKIGEPLVAASLELSTDVWYRVKPPAFYTPVRYKYSKLAPKPQGATPATRQSAPPGDEPLEPPVKRIRLDPTANSEPQPQTKKPSPRIMVQSGSNIPTSLPNGSLRTGFVLQDRTPAPTIAPPPKQNHSIQVSGASGAAPMSHVRSLLTNQIFISEALPQSMTISARVTAPSGAANSAAAPVQHGRIIVQRAQDDTADVVPDLVSLNAASPVRNSLGGPLGGPLGGQISTVRATDLDNADADDSCELDQESSLLSGLHGPTNIPEISGGGDSMCDAESSSGEAECGADISAGDAECGADISAGEAVCGADISAGDAECGAVDGACEAEPDAGNINVVLMQTEDGLLLLQKPDGTTLQIQHSGNTIPLETIQYLLAMDASNIPTSPDVAVDK